MSKRAVAFLLLLSSSSSVYAYVTGDALPPPAPLSSRVWSVTSKRSNVPPEGYFSPTNSGGSFLTKVPVTYPMGLGEPLNVIISGNSDADVLKDQKTDGGLRNYFLSFGYASECLGQHLGDDQAADLGDGQGFRNETAVIRWDYGDPQFGSCKETIEGGAHFRYWVQDGSGANSGAIFIAASYELSAKKQHDIIPNGYNLGRDWLVGNATRLSSLVPTPQLSPGAQFSGITSNKNYTYQTSIQYVSGLLPATSDGINHYLTVSQDGKPAIDGLVAVMEVKITARPVDSGAELSERLPATSTWLSFVLPTLCYFVLAP